jgi:hypothetical protein
MFQQYLGGGALVVVWQLISVGVGLILFSKYFMALLMKELDNLIDHSIEDSDLAVLQSESDKKDELNIALNKVEPIENFQKAGTKGK